MKEYPRILFITVNGWNNTSGTATISSIIKGYPPAQVANIFIRPDMPNLAACNYYFNISERDVIRSIFSRKVKPGKIVEKSDVDTPEIASERRERIKMKKIPSFIGEMARNVVWTAGRWKNENLNNFLDAFNPDIIAFPAEGILSFLKLAEYVVNYTSKPYILFFWDDNFTYKSHGISVSRAFLRRKIKELAKDSSASFAIAPKMQKECACELGIKPVLITKPISMKANTTRQYERNESFPIKILYAGSLYIDRYKTIEKLIRAIKMINADGPKFFLDIYTNSKLPASDEANFNVIGVCSLHAGVKKERILELQNDSDLLLFVEALEGKYRHAARLSFSTKITDYLSANRAILAIGPDDIAPIEYLNENNIAIIASNEDELMDQLMYIASNPKEILNEYAERAFSFGKANHSPDKVFETFCKTVRRVKNGKEKY